ncbi:MAG: hypothetical protein ACKV19_26885 [Verrucomicrobiales bacterium]
MSLEDTINRAAGELPDGWQITITVELGAGWVELINSDGDSLDFPFAGSISEQVSDAITYANDNS